MTEAQAHFQQGCSLFVDEDYEGALAAFDKAVAADAASEAAQEYYVKRSACAHKLKKYTEALADANAALKINPNNAKAYFRKGMSCFSLDEFETAKAAFEKGKALDPQDSSFQLWIRKCNAELEDTENELHSDTSSETVVEKVAERPANPAPIVEEPKKVEKPEEQENKTTEEPLVPAVEEVKPKVRHSWYQNDSFVCITFFIRDRVEKEVGITFGSKSLDVDIQLPDGSNFIFDIELCNEVNPSECKMTITKANVEVKLKKLKSLNWATLEYTGVPSSSMNPVADTIKHLYPTSSKKKKNWDQVASQIEEDKLEGEQALNKVFQDIYGNGSEEQRRAMIKSFVESGGTVLSTNWDEVGKGEVKGTPPKGMEMRNYHE